MGKAVFACWQGGARFAWALILGLLLVVICRWPFPAAFKSIVGSDKTQGFSVDESTLNFGRLWSTSEAARTIRLTNESDKPLQILSCAQACSCTRINYEQKLITPGESTSIEVSVRPQTTTDQSAWEGSLIVGVGDFNGGFIQQIPLNLRGQVAVSTKSSLAPVRLQDGPGFARTTVNVELESEFRDCEVLSAPEWISVDLQSDIDRRQFFLTLTLQKPLLLPWNGRAVESQVKFRALPIRGSDSPGEFAIAVIARRTPRVAVYPAELSFGIRPHGEACSGRLMIYSPIGEALSISHAASSDVTVVAKIVSPDRWDVQAVDVTWKPAALGDLSSSVHFSVGLSDEQVEFDVPVLGWFTEKTANNESSTSSVIRNVN